MAKRGRPFGSTNKKRRGRPVGSKNKLTTVTPIIRINLKCRICKKHYTGKYGIRTDNPELYTKEIKANWICPLCK